MTPWKTAGFQDDPMGPKRIPYPTKSAKFGWLAWTS